MKIKINKDIAFIAMVIISITVVIISFQTEYFLLLCFVIASLLASTGLKYNIYAESIFSEEERFIRLYGKRRNVMEITAKGVVMFISLFIVMIMIMYLLTESRHALDESSPALGALFHLIMVLLIGITLDSLWDSIKRLLEGGKNKNENNKNNKRNI